MTVAQAWGFGSGVRVSRVAVNRHGHTSLKNTGSDSRPIEMVALQPFLN